jgi:predicted transcriptional regulator
MQQPQSDPFLEKLRADVLKGLEEARRGELLPAEDVWARIDAAICQVERDKQA